ncbi:hypothetical protein [Nodularia chucula]|uniref:hypothetical protein n=1 Tax=Nodularia chucula TaxID=3093667 RepID=UPI0039C5F56C
MIKLSHILTLPLVVGTAATAVVASTLPAHALTWTANNILFADGGTLTGSFDFVGNAYQNVNLTLTGPAILGAAGTTPSGPNGTITFNSPAQNAVAANPASFWFTNDGQFVTVVPPGTVTFSTGVFLSGFNLTNPGTATPTSGNYGVFGSTPVNYASGNFVSSPVSPPPQDIPFDIPGGATIPTIGSVLALGLMRKAKKSLALKAQMSQNINSKVSVN